MHPRISVRVLLRENNRRQAKRRAAAETAARKPIKHFIHSMAWHHNFRYSIISNQYVKLVKAMNIMSH